MRELVLNDGTDVSVWEVSETAELDLAGLLVAGCRETLTWPIWKVVQASLHGGSRLRKVPEGTADPRPSPRLMAR